MQETAEPTVASRIARRFHGFVVLAEKLGTFPLGQIPENHLRVAGILVTDRRGGHAAKPTLRALDAGRSTPPSCHGRSVPAACDKSGARRAYRLVIRSAARSAMARTVAFGWALGIGHGCAVSRAPGPLHGAGAAGRC